MDKNTHIPLRDVNVDISSEVARGKKFEEFLRKKSQEIADSIGDGEGLNEAIAQLAKERGLNRLHIQRFVEEVNTLSFNVRYKNVSNERDRRVVFELADLDKIIEYMGDDAPGEVVNPNFPNGFIDPELGYQGSEFSKVASFEPTRSKGTDLIQDEIYRRESLMKRANHEYKNKLSKIGSTLINTELRHRNANEVFNTLVSDAGLNKKATKDIMESVDGGISLLKKANRLPEDFELNLFFNPMEKKAHNIFGKHSLLPNNDTTVYDIPKVAHTDDISDYHDLKKVAHSLLEKYEVITKNMEVIR